MKTSRVFSFGLSPIVFSLVSVGCAARANAVQPEELPPEVLSQLQSADPQWLTTTLLDLDDSFNLLINSFELAPEQREQLRKDLYYRLPKQAAFEKERMAEFEELSAKMNESQDEIERRAYGDRLTRAIDDFSKNAPLSVFNVALQLAAPLPEHQAKPILFRLHALLTRQELLNQIREADNELVAGKKQLLVYARLARMAQESSSGKPQPQRFERQQSRNSHGDSPFARAESSSIDVAVIGDGVFPPRDGLARPDLDQRQTASGGETPSIADHSRFSHLTSAWTHLIRQRTRTDRWSDRTRIRANLILDEFMHRLELASHLHDAAPAIFDALSVEFNQRMAVLSPAKSE